MKPETASEVLDAYLSFLWEQFQYDWDWLSNPWLLVIGNLLYLVFFTVKWTVLLFPVTVPISTWQWFDWRQSPRCDCDKNGKFTNN